VILVRIVLEVLRSGQPPAWPDPEAAAIWPQVRYRRRSCGNEAPRSLKVAVPAAQTFGSRR